MYAQFHVMVSVGLLQGERVEPKDQNRVLSLRTYHVCLVELCVGTLDWLSGLKWCEQCLNNVCTVSCHGVCGSIAR